MSKINILDKSIYSLIAAGEVVERPRSIVKELLENSIDAGATNIVIEITNGGLESIKVSDNGCGIAKEDLQAAFLPHATSKISKAEDLEHIGTLGFRGEALSTIAAVSKVTMITKTENADCGNIIKISGGEIESIEPIGCSNGTTIYSKDIFYNIPARRKFLGKPRSEEAEITNIVARIILSHPDIAIEYVSDGKQIYKSTGAGLFDAIYSIYGKSVINNLIEVKFDRDGIKVWGYVGKPSFAKHNRTYQTLIVNGRYVVNQTVSTAIFKSFENYLMKNLFPFFVLNMELDLSEVDVNVHPNKMDIKFANTKKVFEIMLIEISKVLLDSINLENVVMTNAESVEMNPKINLNNLQVINDNEGISYSKNIIDNQNTAINSVKDNTTSYIRPQEVLIENDIIDNNKDKNTKFSFDYNQKFDISPIDNFNGEYVLHSPSDVEQKITEISNRAQLVIADDSKIQDASQILNDSNYQVIGTLFDTYIVLQFADYIYLIDQHAGHERVLFDKLCKELKDGSVISQPLLIPYTFTTNSIETSFMLNILDEINNLGFEIDEFGNNVFRVSSVPLILKNISLKNFFADILKDINAPKLNLSEIDVIYDFLASTACKHAIKAYDKLDKSQIDFLLELLKDTPVLLCPHGRPIVLKITEKEIEKWFKRIV